MGLRGKYGNVMHQNQYGFRIQMKSHANIAPNSNGDVAFWKATRPVLHFMNHVDPFLRIAHIYITCKLRHAISIKKNRAVRIRTVYEDQTTCKFVKGDGVWLWKALAPLTGATVYNWRCVLHIDPDSRAYLRILESFFNPLETRAPEYVNICPRVGLSQ
jgi:hypothetical protein